MQLRICHFCFKIGWILAAQYSVSLLCIMTMCSPQAIILTKACLQVITTLCITSSHRIWLCWRMMQTMKCKADFWQHALMRANCWADGSLVSTASAAIPSPNTLQGVPVRRLSLGISWGFLDLYPRPMRRLGLRCPKVPQRLPHEQRHPLSIHSIRLVVTVCDVPACASHSSFVFVIPSGKWQWPPQRLPPQRCFRLPHVAARRVPDFCRIPPGMHQ